MNSTKAVKLARKMVATKGIQSQIPSVIDVRRFVQSGMNKAKAGQLVDKNQFLELSNKIRGLSSIGQLIAQSGSSAGDKDASWSESSWINSVSEAAKLARYAMSYSSPEQVAQYGEDKMASAQFGWLRSIDSKLEYLISDIKRNARNFAQSGRHRG